MPEQNLTKAAIQGLTPPSSGRLEIRDTRVPGLRLRVTPTGARSFYVRRRVNGAPRYVRLGAWPDMTIEQARRMAQGELAAIAGGEDPAAKRKAARVARQREQAASVTLRQVFAEYRTSRRSDGKARKPSTLADIDGHLQRNFEDWLDRPIAEITRDGVLARHRKIARRGTYQADQALRYLRSLINFARDRYTGPDGAPVLPANPVDVLRAARAWHAPERRRHVIPRAKLGATVAALEALATEPAELRVTQTAADLLLFLLFTGLRHGEAAALRWSDVDREAGTLTLADPKNRRPVALPYSSAAAGVIERRSSADSDAAYVFPGRSGRHMNETRGVRGKVADAAGGPFTNHDLRRTFVSVAESLDVGEYTLKRLLNHAITASDVTGGYVIPDTERLRAAAQRVGDFMRAEAAAATAANVVQLHSEGTR